jgi:hypothetical protein
MEPPKLSPLPRPVPWACDPTFIPVGVKERESYELTVEATFDFLCQRCEDLLRNTPDTPKISIDGVTESDITMEGQLKVDVGLLLDSAVRGCYVCTLLLRETQRSNGATMPTLPSKSIYSYLLCSRSLVSAGTKGNEDRRCYEDDYGATHGIILTDCHELGNSYVTLFVRHPSTSKPPHAFCRSIYMGSDECLERCKL